MDLGIPSHPIAEQRCAIVHSAPVGRRYHRLTIDAGLLAGRTRPGQFYHLLCQDGPGVPYLRRPMSVWQVDDSRVSFLFNVTGRGTAALATRRPGDSLSVVGPLGTGFTLDPAAKRILLVARGAGLATLAPLAALAVRSGIAVDAVLSARTPAEVMADAFPAGVSITGVADSDATSDPDAVEALLRTLIDTARPDAIYTCGSNRLLVLLQRLGTHYAVPGQVALEQQMGCGLGMCFCCVRAVRTHEGIAHKRVCVEGPVFDLQSAISE